jgi:hypothetical protein
MKGCGGYWRNWLQMTEICATNARASVAFACKGAPAEA